VGVKDSALRSMDIAGLPTAVDEFEHRSRIVGMPCGAETRTTATSVSRMRDCYDCLLLDLGCFDASPGLTRVASHCDGVVLVAAAGQASKAQMRRAAQTVHRAEGKLLGVVLNKRTYPIPAWLYRLL
jgi:hypothetical protein